MPTNGQAQIKYPWETDGAPTSLPGAAPTGTAAAPVGAPTAPAETAAASDGSVPYPWEVPADQTKAQQAQPAPAPGPVAPPQAELKSFSQHPSNLFYRNIRATQSPEQIAGRQQAAITGARGALMAPAIVAGGMLVPEIVGPAVAGGLGGGGLAVLTGGAVGGAAGGAVTGAGEELARSETTGQPLLSRQAARNIGSQAVTGGALGTLFPAGEQSGPLGTLLKKASGQMAESALDITAKMRGRGRTIGQAVLEETKGLRPGAIEQSADAAMSQLKQTRDHLLGLATNAGLTGSTATARQVLQGMIDAIPRGSSPEFAEKLRGLFSHMELGQPGKTVFTPTELQEVKAAIDNSIKSWGPEWKDPRGLGPKVEAVAQRLYGEIDRELDRMVPEHAGLNQRISSLIPASSQAEAEGYGPGIVQRGMARVKKPTGALVSTLLGAGEGGRIAGLPGAALGGMAGLVIPEMVGSTAGQMSMARALNWAARSGLPPAVLRTLGLAAARPDGESK